jgi:hypothetical protein
VYVKQILKSYLPVLEGHIPVISYLYSVSRKNSVLLLLPLLITITAATIVATAPSVVVQKTSNFIPTTSKPLFLSLFNDALPVELVMQCRMTGHCE